MIRRVRAVIVLGLLWAIGWALLGGLVGAYDYYRTGLFNMIFPDPPFQVSLFSAITFFGKTWAMRGGVSGALFAVVLSLIERKKATAQLALGRVALWGILGSLLIPGAFIPLQLLRFGVDAWPVVLFLGIGIAGGLSAVGTVAAARRTLVAPPPGSLTSA
jgi:hypothetical protein